MGSRAQRIDITLRGGPAGEFVGGSSAGDLRRPWRQIPFSTGALLRIMEGPFTGNSERYLKGGSGGGASLSTGTLWTEPGGVLLIRGPEVYIEEGSGDGHPSIWAPLGNLNGSHLVGTLRDGWDVFLCLRGPGEVAHLLWTLRIHWRRTLAVEHLSLWELC